VIRRCALVVFVVYACSAQNHASTSDGTGGAAAPMSPFGMMGSGGAPARTDTAGTGGVVASSGAGGAAPFDAGRARMDASASDASKPLDASTESDARIASDAAGMDAGPVAIPEAHDIHGVNWADPSDNFVDGVLQLSGLDASTDTYDTVRTKAARVANEFRDKLGANTIRIPINEPTVASPFWDAYKAVIDATTELGMT
jgi:hypothetical protein